jgi:uncharacterized protein
MSTSADDASDPRGQQPLPYSGGYQGQGRQPLPHGQPQARTTPEERNWAVAGHVGSFLAAWAALGLLAPLIVLLTKGSESAYVRRHAVESLNFQINALVYTVVFALLIIVLIGIPLLIAYAIFYAICVILATVRSSNGEEYRYPMTVRLIT